MRLLVCFTGILFVFSVLGCASTGGATKDNQIQLLQAQVSKLQEEVKQKNEDIEALEGQLEQGQSRKTASLTENKTGGTGVSMTSKKIQLALKKAGFYKGPVDGKIGNETKKAIKEFQKANGLRADGVAGKETRLKLRKYLN